MKVMTEELTNELIRLLLSNDKTLYDELNDKNPPLLSKNSSELENINIKDNQIIFLKDINRIVYDIGGERYFYNSISILENDSDRLSVDTVFQTGFYYILKTSSLWYYSNQWIQITNGVSNPIVLEKSDTGKENTLYIDKDLKDISIFDVSNNKYIKVSNLTEPLNVSDIDNLFMED